MSNSFKNFGFWTLLSLIAAPAFADGLYHYKGGDGCTLKKYENKAWSEASPDAIGTNSFTIQLSRANPNAAVFAVQGSTYGTKKDCLEESPQSASQSPKVSGGHRYYVEPRLAFLIGGGSGTSSTASGITTTTQKYSPGIEFAGRFGYGVDFWSPKDFVFAELGYFSGSQNETINVASASLSDNVLMFNVGYQHYLTQRGKFTPFGSLAIGYNHLSGTVTAPGASATYSASGVGAIIEAGTLYDLSTRFQLLGSLSYHIMSFSPTFGASNSAAFTVGGTVPDPASYSNFGINLGARYNF